MAEEETITVVENTDANTAPEEVSEEATEEVEAEEAETETDEESETSETEDKPKKLTPEQKKLAKQARDYREVRRENKRLARMLEQQIQSTAKSNQEPKAPKIDEFDSIEDYLEARDNFRESKSKPEQSTEESADHSDFIEARDYLQEIGSDKYDDFTDVVFGDNVSITMAMAEALFDIDDDDLQADVAYSLGKNTKETNRIAKLSARRQIAEIGKIEYKLSNKIKAKQEPSKAPAPIKPVGGSRTPSNVIKAQMSPEEFNRVRNKQLGRT